jgi:hypothetical protein
MISFQQSGDFKHIEAFLREMTTKDLFATLSRYGQMGVAALASATPADSGVAAGSWGFVVEKSKGSASIIWTNSDVENGFPVVVMLQHGHGTGTGGYVQGRDFINPAIQPIFDKISDDVWKAVTSA